VPDAVLALRVSRWPVAAAAAARRWLLIGLIPIVGWIVLIVFFMQDSQPGNQYRPNPGGLGEGHGAGYSETAEAPRCAGDDVLRRPSGRAIVVWLPVATGAMGSSGTRNRGPGCRRQNVHLAGARGSGR